MLKTVFFFFIYLLTLPAFSQNVYFEKVFGTAGSDFARAVRQADSGSIYVGGYSDSGTYGEFDISLSKLDKQGNLIWTKYYGYAYADYCLYMNKTRGGNLVICGETYTASAESNVIVLKLDTAGNKIWEKIFNIPLYESAKYIEETKDNGFIMSGFKSDTSGSNDIYIIKLDSLGNKQWEKTIGGTGNDYSDMIRQTEDGGYILTSDTQSKGAGGVDIEVTKLDSLGNIIWDYTFGNSFQNGCQGILVTSDKKYLSYGETNILYNYSPFNFYIEKLDTNGQSLWKVTPGGTGSDAAFSAVETEDRGFIFAGYSNSYNGGAPIDLVIFKIDSLGNLLWVNSYGGQGIDIGYDIIPSIDNGFLITGKIYSGTDDYFLLHLNKEGTLTGNNKYLKQKINVYPNPCINGFYITLPFKEEYILNIYSVEGKLVFTETFNTNGFIPRTKIREKGIYFIEIKTSHEIYSSQILVSD